MEGMKKKFSFEKFRKEVGARIRYFRDQREMTQDKLAEDAEITRSFIGPIERGEKPPSLETIGKIAHALDVSVHQLFMIESEVTARQRLAQEWIALIADQPEKQAEFLVSIARESRKRYS